MPLCLRVACSLKASHYRHASKKRHKSLIKSSDSLYQALHLLVQEPSHDPDWEWLAQDALAEVDRAQALGLTPATVTAAMHQRAKLLQTIYPEFCQVSPQLLGQPDAYLTTLWNLWLPLAQHLGDRRQQQGRPFVQGILGGQGTGKTTLGVVLTLILRHLGYQTLSLSLDDLYKTYGDRLQLQQHDPRLVWRGPPGTHDVKLGIQVLDQLRQSSQSAIPIPRFDKSLHQGAGDRVSPELVQNIDIVLFEGWFVGVQPIDPAQFDQAPAPICSESDRAFARDMNARLQTYLPLWQRLDSLWVLYLPDFQQSKQWRKQAEHQMIAAGKPGMSDAEIDAFVEYFWKALHPALFITPTVQTADLVIEINPDHSPGKVYGGGL